MKRVFDRCHRSIVEACARSSAPAEFLAALTGNESSGDPKVARFEPAVYRHLKAVANGQSIAYAGLHSSDLVPETEEIIKEILHPKAEFFHARYLTEPFSANHRDDIASLKDEALRELGTSWGLTQIMGYHMVGRGGTPRDLFRDDPPGRLYHFRVALEILAEFADDYQLDLAHEFEEMFRCWNTGAPYGETFDPSYVQNGIRRMEIYRRISAAPNEFRDH